MRWNQSSHLAAAGRIVLILTILCLLLGVTLSTWAQWGRVGAAKREDTRSVAFGRTGGTTYAYAGHRNFGVYRSTNDGSGWTAWQQTSLDEYALYDSSTGKAAQVNVVGALPNYDAQQVVYAGTAAGDVWFSDDHGANWYLATGLNENRCGG